MSTKNIIFTGFLILMLLFFVKIFDISYPITVVTTTKTTELAVVGEGKVEVTPDTAYVETGITVTDEPTVAEAQKTIDRVNNQIIGQMKALGIDKKDIKTTNYSIYPNYDYSEKTNKISGYNGNVLITIKTKNLTLISQIIEKATSAGANQIQGVRLIVDKPETYREMAREEAIKNAKEQAQKLAKKLGIKLGGIVNIVESGPDSALSFSQKYPVAGLGKAAENVEIEPGSQTITSTVTLYFEKK
jgi:hypothetical protein